jgi:glycosyltransferase involved in cell wall biosynthesis
MRISAIITAYNCDAYIGDAIESVLAQTRRPDEVVVVDDGSTDGTAAIVQSYAAAGVRHIWQENGGPGAARNRGIAETSGALVCFLDGDDLWLPEKTARQEAFLAANPQVGMVTCDRWTWNVLHNKRRLERYGVAPGQSLRREILVRNVIGNPSMVMVRRAVLDAAGGFNTSMRWAEEWELWIRIAARAEIGVVHTPLVTYRAHIGGLSHANLWARFDGQHRIAARAIGLYAAPPARPLLLLRSWSLAEHARAVYAIRYGLPLPQRMRHIIAALVANPFEQPVAKLKLIIHGLLGEEPYHRAKRQLRAALGRGERPPHVEELPLP